MNKLKIILITNLSKSRGGAFIAALRISNILKKIYNIKIIPPDIDGYVDKIIYCLSKITQKNLSKSRNRIKKMFDEKKILKNIKML